MKVYVLLTDTGTLLSECIKMYTKKPYNHSSLSLDCNLEQVFSFGRKEISSPLYAGFVKEDIQHDFFRRSKCEIYSCNITKEQYMILTQKIIEFEQKQAIYKYNLLGLFGVALNRKWVRPDAFFCSQFVAHLLIEIGIFDHHKPPCLITPNDFRISSKLNLVYSGDLDEYLSYSLSNKSIAQ